MPQKRPPIAKRLKRNRKDDIIYTTKRKTGAAKPPIQKNAGESKFAGYASKTTTYRKSLETKPEKRYNIINERTNIIA
jgi:hypothetical protein